MLKISLAIAAALIAGSAFFTTAEAGGCHHGFGGGFAHQSIASQSYAYEEERHYKKRRAVAQARAANAHQLAAQRAAAAKVNVEKVETAPVKVADATVNKSKQNVVKGDALTEVASATQVCRKFSPTVGGMVETPCE